jgi:hypothetical protein
MGVVDLSVNRLFAAAPVASILQKIRDAGLHATKHIQQPAEKCEVVPSTRNTQAKTLARYNIFYHTIVQHCDAIRYHLILYYNMMAGLKDAAMAAGEMQPWRLARHESLGQWRSHAGELPLVRLVKLALQRRFQSQQGASV